MTRIKYNYYKIIKNLSRYLPSKIIVLICSFLIIPLFTHILSVKEVSIYLISIQLLNLFCTFSSDWISKAVLRFYAKYKLKNRLQDFMSTIFWFFSSVYFVIIILTFILKDIIYTNFQVNSLLLGIVVLLVIPCGIRQVLYQILRIKNKPLIYAMSIIFYETTFVVIFLMLAKILPNAFSIILAMFTALVIVDIFLIKSTCCFRMAMLSKPNKKIVLNILKYALPLVFTNISYWLFLYYPLFLFQKAEQYILSATYNVSLIIVNYVITTIASLFLFTAFPIFVDKYEQNKNIKLYFTNLVQLYIYFLIPLVFLCCFFSKEITLLILPSKYYLVQNILPFFAIITFIHELMKIINVKYHLKIKTYLETLINSSTIFVFLCSVPFILNNYSIETLVVLLLIVVLILFLFNIMFKIKNIDYIDYLMVGKTLIKISVINFVVCIFIKTIQVPCDNIFMLVKILLFLILTYLLNYLFRKKILY